MIRVILHGFFGTQHFTYASWRQVLDFIERSDKVSIRVGVVTLATVIIDRSR